MLSSRSHQRRRVYLTEGIELSDRFAVLDLSRDGLGVAVVDGPVPSVGETIEIGGTAAVVRHTGRLRSGDRILPRLGLSLVAAQERCAGVIVPGDMPVFASAPSP